MDILASFLTSLPGLLLNPVVVGGLLSLLVERWAWFQVQTASAKAWLALVIALLLPPAGLLLGLGLGVYLPPADGSVFAWLAGQVISAIGQGIIAWGTSQFAHSLDPIFLKKRLSRK